MEAERHHGLDDEIEADLGLDLDPEDDALPARARARAAESWVDPSEERGFAVAVMGGTQRAGNWEPPETLYAAAFMGGVKLDFRHALLLEGVTQLRVIALMGGVQIIVPPDLDVEVNGVGLMGGFKHLNQHAADDDDDLDRPLLRISGLALMGGVDVKVG